MNRIEVVNDIVVKKEVDENIEVEFEEKNELFSINKLKIKVVADTELEILYHGEEKNKLDIFVNVLENATCKLYEIRTCEDCKIQYKYYLKEKAKLEVNRFYKVKEAKELDIINLNGEGATFDFHFKTLALEKQKYNMVVYHNVKNTHSNLINHGVTTQDGKIEQVMTSIVLNGKKDCTLNQLGKIVPLNEEKSSIHPILLIEENDIDANHAAHLGGFSKEELFYMESRGISEETAIQMLLEGFLRSNITFTKAFQELFEHEIKDLEV